MVLGFGGGSGGGAGANDVNTLIARKNYGKAIEVIKAQLAARKSDPRLRMQLADVLTLAGGGKEAIQVLLPLADEYAKEGFAAKAIAVLKKVEKIDPGRRDVEGKLATLIRQGKGPVPLSQRIPTETMEIGIEELSMAMSSRSAPAAPVAPDFDADLAVEVEEEAAAEPAAPAMTESAFRDGLLDVIGNAIESSSTADEAAEEAAAIAAGQQEPEKSGKVESALFAAFSQEELVEVIHGLQLLSFEAGDILITEGEPGSSLFVLTSGYAKAFVRNPQGKHVFVRALREGDFFGEISILTGKPRTATVTAGTDCELLELDRVTLDAIAETKPHVWEVLKDFYTLRANSVKERRIRESS
jgi:hypothetical protein